MSLILCYCEKCGQTNAISDTELDNIKEEKCVNCDTIGYYKVVPKEYLTDDKVKQANVPKCPTCQSTNLKKITVTSKAMNTALFGLFGTKRHKTFHCNNCGYEW